MKIAMICFSMTGCATAEKLRGAFLDETGGFTRMENSKCLPHDAEKLRRSESVEVRLAKKSRYIPDAEPVRVDEWTKEQFAWADCIIFVGACGIAVRHIAPYIKSKKTDPAVLVADECGKFVISLLSGHLGGANELAQKAAQILDAIPVVTTATDLHHCFAVDVFARKNNCGILNLQAAKKVSAALLAGEKVGFYSEFPWEGELPEGLVRCDAQGVECPLPGHSEQSGDEQSGARIRYGIGIAVTICRACRPFKATVTIIPQAVVLGIGCRRGKDAEGILTAAREAVHRNGLYQQSVAKIASIDLKKEEPGLLALAQRWNIPVETFSEEELQKVEGRFTPSAFVQSVTGVDNVCERSAVLGSKYGTLIQKKISGDGVTTAVAVQKRRLYFE